MRVLLAVAAIAAAQAVAAAAPGPAIAPKGRTAPRATGKVIRIERPRAAGPRTPRLCQVLLEDRRGYCFGRAPTVGDVAQVVDSGGLRATIRLSTTVETRDPCGNVVMWEIAFEVIAGDPSQSQAHSPLALFDAAVGPRTRLLEANQVEPPGHQPGATTWTAIDFDGDDAADFAVVTFTCDRSGVPINGPHEAYCAEYWVSELGRWVQQRTDVVVTCQ